MTIRLLFKISTSHWYEQYPHYEQYPQFTISTVPQKSRGTSYCSNNHYSQQSWQITVAVGGKSISPKWKQDSSVISAASYAPLSLYKRAQSSVFSRSNLAQQQIASLFSKGFHSRNTLEVQSSFRSSHLNTINCKPQSATLFYLPHYLVSEPSRLILSLCNLRPFWYQSQVWPGQL